MTLPWYLTAAGLYLATAAVWFMYRYPMSVAPEATVHARHRRCARLGVGLLGTGFFLQFLGVLLGAVR